MISRSDMYRDQYERIATLTDNFHASFFTCLLRQDLAYTFKQSVYMLKTVDLLSMVPPAHVTKHGVNTAYRFDMHLFIRQHLSLEELKTMHVCVFLQQYMLFRGIPHAYKCTTTADGVDMRISVGLHMRLIGYDNLIQAVRNVQRINK